ncbi:serine O-acetyltransferase [Pantoea sp. FN060301]|uniref:serine O-acetyltransferase n=1 Tax=Pantoea sp. FN060301 TaxID=3420380 RepID=UPI003D17DDB1
MQNADLLVHLKECLRREVMMSGRPFSWAKVIHKAIKCPGRRYLFWWRLASYLYHTGGPWRKKLAKRINRKITLKYGTEIQLGARIGAGMTVSHHYGIVINGSTTIGENFKIRQNTTIGIPGNPEKSKGELTTILIGDNVTVGASSCIIGNDLTVGNNVTIGAMSFINKSIPDSCTVYTEKRTTIVFHEKN